MKMDEFTKLFAELFEETDKSQFDATTIFKELDEWSSLLALSVIAMVDEEFNVTLNGEDIRNSKTLEDIFITINVKSAKNNTR